MTRQYIWFREKKNLSGQHRLCDTRTSPGLSLFTLTFYSYSSNMEHRTHCSSDYPGELGNGCSDDRGNVHGNDIGNIHTTCRGNILSKDHANVEDVHATHGTVIHGSIHGDLREVDHDAYIHACGTTAADDCGDVCSGDHCTVRWDNHINNLSDGLAKICPNGGVHAYGSNHGATEGRTCIACLAPSDQTLSTTSGRSYDHDANSVWITTNTYRINHSYGTKQSNTNWMRVLLILLAVLPSLAKGPHGSSPNSLSGHSGSAVGKNGIFLQSNHTEITAQAGATAALHCRLSSPLGDGMVSWVRRRDYHLLTVGRQVYSSDARVGVKVSPDGCDWMLTVRWVAPHDAGQYECQVSSHPPQALMVNLHVVEAHAEIVGGSERFIHHGSLLKLVCLLKSATEPPVYVFWYRDDRMINYDKERGVSVDNSGKSSKLYISSVSRRDEGNYTCLPSNAAPASVMVTVIQKENPAGLQQETNTDKEASSASSSASSSSSSSSSSVSSSNSSSGAVDRTAIFSLYLLPLSLPTLLPLFSRHFFR
ncbi:uncharacterized protein [Panulirus ornatus]|uniref:uncharacterized protein n=1 Tax=Panulirus ornatus TaxID=150431 RepID=UPI003A8B972A